MKRGVLLVWAMVAGLAATGCTAPATTTTAGTSSGTSATTTTAVTSSPAVTTTPLTTAPTTSAPATTAPATTAVHTTPSGMEVADFYPAGSAVLYDLDGDGSDEEIYYDTSDLIINGTSYRESVGDDIFLNEPNDVHFLIVDINTVDVGKELGILTAGPSDDHEVFFFDYRPGGLDLIGSVPVYMGDLSTAFDGEGYIYGDKRLSVLQTWYAPARWKLEGGYILDSPYDLYYPRVYPYMETIVLKEDLPIYANPEDAAPSATMTPQEVEFKATDNSNWVKIRAQDGTEGWFKFDQWDHLIDLDRSASDVFENLFMAD